MNSHETGAPSRRLFTDCTGLIAHLGLPVPRTGKWVMELLIRKVLGEQESEPKEGGWLRCWGQAIFSLHKGNHH